MSLINKERIDKYNGIAYGLSSFIPEEIDRDRLFEIFISEFDNISKEEKEILLDTINVFNLFNWCDSDQGFSFWEK